MTSIASSCMRLLRAATSDETTSPRPQKLSLRLRIASLLHPRILASTSCRAQSPQHRYRACFTRHYCSIAFVCLCTCISTRTLLISPTAAVPPSLRPDTSPHTRYRHTQPPPWFSSRIKSTSARRRSASSRTASAPPTGSDGAPTLPRGSGLPVSILHTICSFTNADLPTVREDYS